MNRPSKKTVVADQWRAVLKGTAAYRHHCNDRAAFDRISKFSRMWRRILSHIQCSGDGKGRSVFEVGFGGGKHLAAFALNRWQASGIECSEEMVKNAKNYFDDIARYQENIHRSVELIQGDFIDHASSDFGRKFDLVYQVGVIEHFLNPQERMHFLEKMFDLTQSGGFVVSIVPNGAHPLRSKVQELGLGGYCVPEINYTAQSLQDEMILCGGRQVTVMPHNLCNYFLLEGGYQSSLFMRKCAYYAVQCIPPRWIPKKMAQKHAEVLIGIALKQ